MSIDHANAIGPGTRGSMSPYYRPSCKIPARGFRAAAFGALAAMLAACLYAWVTIPAPAPVNVLTLLVFGVAIGLVVDRVAHLGHVRSRTWITRYAIVLTAWAWYCQWVAWLAFSAQRSHGGLLLQHVAGLMVDPGALFAAAGAVAQAHARDVGTLTMAGIWLLEALVLFACAPWWGRGRTAQPYCDASAAWADPIRVPWDFACVDDPVAAVQLLEQAPEQLLSLLVRLAQPEAPDATSYTSATLYRCRCGDAYVSIANVYFDTSSPNASIYHEQEWITLLRLPDAAAKRWMSQLLPSGSS
jgi:hypothetical protein